MFGKFYLQTPNRLTENVILSFLLRSVEMFAFIWGILKNKCTSSFKMGSFVSKQLLIGGLASNCYVTSLSFFFFSFLFQNLKNPSISLSLQRETWALICFVAAPASSSSLQVLPSALVQILGNDSWEREQKAKAHAIQL